MKIVGLLGSPRPKGCSSLIASRFLETAESLAAEVQTFDLNKLNYSHCQACMTCKTLDTCVLKDDLTEVLDAICDADILVMASPIYFGELTHKLQIFIERTHCYIEPDFLTSPNPSRLKLGKKLVFILTQGQADKSTSANAYQRYNHFFRWCGFHDNHLIRAFGVSDVGDVGAREKVMKLAEETAKRLVS